jgi:hypothetical protein
LWLFATVFHFGFPLLEREILFTELQEIADIHSNGSLKAEDGVSGFLRKEKREKRCRLQLFSGKDSVSLFSLFEPMRLELLLSTTQREMENVWVSAFAIDF